MLQIRMGLGQDLHRLKAGGPLRIGGVDIPSEVEAVGHSDGDALLHAVTDGILGALSLGDIGRHFSDLDPENKGIDSAVMLEHALALARQRGWQPVQIDTVISLQSPKLAPHMESMQERVAEILGVKPDFVSIKAKTGEGLGPIGEGLAISCDAIVQMGRT